MSENTTSNPPTTATTGQPAGATRARGTRTATKTDTGPIVIAPEASAGSAATAPATAPAADRAAGKDVPGAAEPVSTATAPVTVRPRVRGPRSGPLTRMGPWAPVAGGVLGLLAGLVAVLLLAESADTFDDRLALVLLVVGLGMLGTAGTLLADEVHMVRQGTREAAVRPAWVEATVPLLSGLTPARLLLVMSAFVLFLAAFVTR